MGNLTIAVEQSSCVLVKWMDSKGLCKEAWLDHKRECKCLQNVKPNFPPDSVRLAGRIVFKLVTCLSERLYSFSDLQSSNMGFPNESGNPGFFPLFLQVTCNCFTISNGEMQDVGVGLYPSMSLLNHSCDPNCVIIFEGYQLLLRSVREIQIGEELTISYIESLMPTSERQKQLKRQYCFECDCCLCQDQEKVEWEKVLAKCQHLLSSHASRLPDTNIYQLKLLDCAMDACINLEAWEQALCYGSRTLGPYRLYYPDFHPLRAVQLMRVGKLQYSQGMLPQALETLKQVSTLDLLVFYCEPHNQQAWFLIPPISVSLTIFFSLFLQLLY
uniref:[histone H3]-lysine(4) N-trimethyltransferase n=1 Tax=Pavo cristatus TaxID=9049 RepID=A0A8C9FXB7_PAVCR